MSKTRLRRFAVVALVGAIAIWALGWLHYERLPTTADVEKNITIGMSRADARAFLGTPLTDHETSGLWQLRDGRVAVFFDENDRVRSFLAVPWTQWDLFRQRVKDLTGF
ncbi:MAG: hypothetical protein ACJ8C4_09610 [Gemmataceae bacterium]